MPASILDNILALLDDHGIACRRLHHRPTYTSADAARVRGEFLHIGGKALLLKADDRFVLVVISAALRLDSAALRRELGIRRSRFATPAELADLTGLVPGSVPPFGRPILPLTLYVDRSVLANDRIAFNAASLTDSIIMSVEDYRRIARIEKVIDVAQKTTDPA